MRIMQKIVGPKQRVNSIIFWGIFIHLPKMASIYEIQIKQYIYIKYLHNLCKAFGVYITETISRGVRKHTETK